MNLSIFVIVPLLMLLGLWLARNDKQVRGVMVAGASVLLALSIYLVFAFLEARETMPADQAPMKNKSAESTKKYCTGIISYPPFLRLRYHR
jgi:glucan phosphoethanolaminetransferase (alkaline phosphatase superfamily)